MERWLCRALCVCVCECWVDRRGKRSDTEEKTRLAVNGFLGIFGKLSIYTNIGEAFDVISIKRRKALDTKKKSTDVFTTKKRNKKIAKVFSKQTVNKASAEGDFPNGFFDDPNQFT